VCSSDLNTGDAVAAAPVQARRPTPPPTLQSPAPRAQPAQPAQRPVPMARSTGSAAVAQDWEEF
jgi:hypothetical protein